jgi:hypothetical protein
MGAILIAMVLGVVSFITFLVLKLTGAVDWSWGWIVMPVCIVAGIYVTLGVIAAGFRINF